VRLGETGHALRCGCGCVAGALCSKLPCDRCGTRSAHSRCRVSSDLITTVWVARQVSSGRITRARRAHILIKPQLRARARAFKTQPDLRTDSFHQPDAPLGQNWSFLLHTCTHTAWKSTSAPPFFCFFGKVSVETLPISRGQLAPCQEKLIKRQQKKRFAPCKVLIPNAGCL